MANEPKTFNLDFDDKVLEQIFSIRDNLMRSFEPVRSPYFLVLLNENQTEFMFRSNLIYPGIPSNNDGPWRFAGADLYPWWNWPNGSRDGRRAE